MKNSELRALKIFPIAICILLSSCMGILPNDALLKSALDMAGSNRQELEKALDHYSQSDDSLKLKAVVFLIKYMPGKYAKVFPEYNKYKPVFDTLEKLNTDYEKNYKKSHAEFYKHFKRTALNHFMLDHYIKPTSFLDYEIKEDIKTITADYLIENVDYAFKAWQLPWNKTLSFNEFCEYVLPYRYGTEELEPWRKTYYENNIYLLDSFKNERDPVRVCMAIKGLHDVTRSEITELDGLGNSIKPLDLIRINTTTSCKDETGVVLLRLRALGIPLARLTFPNWGNWGSGHDINGVLSLDKTWLPLNVGDNPGKYLPPSQFTVAKLFIETYSSNSNSTFANPSGSYDINPYYIDVTKCITQVTDLTLPFAKSKKDTRAFLCVFNNLEWMPITCSKVRNGKAVFLQMGKRVIYIAATLDKGTLKWEGEPFLLDSNGRAEPITASKKKGTVTLFRKYPPNNFINSILPTLSGCYFEGSNDSAFAEKTILWKIDTLTSLHSLEKDVKNERFRYVRLVFPQFKREHQALGGIQFYDGNKVLTGDPISSTTASKSFYANVFDGKPLTFVRLLTQSNVDFKQFYDGNSLVIPDGRPFSVGLKFENKVNITRIGLAPRTDDNDVNTGESYELYYWNNGSWASLGQKKAGANRIEYAAPEKALYFLRNVNKGKEQRVFLYNHGQQVWY